MTVSKKYAILAIFLVTVVATACNKSDAPTGVDQEITWIMGAEHMGDALFEVPVSTSSMATLDVSEYSICPSEALQITVSSEAGAFILNKLAFADATYALEMPSGSKVLMIQTSLTPHLLETNCVTEGSAIITYRYQN